MSRPLSDPYAGASSLGCNNSGKTAKRVRRGDPYARRLTVIIDRENTAPDGRALTMSARGDEHA